MTVSGAAAIVCKGKGGAHTMTLSSPRRLRSAHPFFLGCALLHFVCVSLISVEEAFEEEEAVCR